MRYPAGWHTILQCSRRTLHPEFRCETFSEPPLCQLVSQGPTPLPSVPFAHQTVLGTDQAMYLCHLDSRPWPGLQPCVPCGMRELAGAPHQPSLPQSVLFPVRMLAGHPERPADPGISNPSQCHCDFRSSLLPQGLPLLYLWWIIAVPLLIP